MSEPLPTIEQINSYIDLAEFLYNVGRQEESLAALSTAFDLWQFLIYGVKKYDIFTLAKNPTKLAEILSTVSNHTSIAMGMGMSPTGCLSRN